MHFGAVFIALIGFTIIMLIVPQFIQASLRRNIDILRDDVLRFAGNRKAPEPSGAGGVIKADELWTFLTYSEDSDQIKNIKLQKYAPLVSILVVLEVCVFAMTSYSVARGHRIPGFIEEMAIVMIFILVAITLLAAYKVLRNNARYNRYLCSYHEFMALAKAAPPDPPQDPPQDPGPTG